MNLSQRAIRAGRRAAVIAGVSLAAHAAAQDHDHRHPDFPPQGVLLPDLTPGHVLIEGDIQIRLDRYLTILAGGEATFGGTLWPGGLVPYVFDANVSAEKQQQMLDAMALISQRAAVTFQPWQPGNPFWIHIQASIANNSPVGMVAPGQILNIVSWSEPLTIVHELFHALGFQHEQTRPDRDTYVTINWQNICSGAEPNFWLNPIAATYGPYDFGSIMHYARDDWSCTGQDTITVNQPWNAQWQGVIGNYTDFSYLDEITCRGLYPFPADRWWAPGSILSSGTFMQPYNVHPTSAVLATPAGGTLFLKHAGAYSGTGLYTSTGPVTIDAPEGPVTLGN